MGVAQVMSQKWEAPCGRENRGWHAGRFHKISLDKWVPVPGRSCWWWGDQEGSSAGQEEQNSELGLRLECQNRQSTGTSVCSRESSSQLHFKMKVVADKAERRMGSKERVSWKPMGKCGRIMNNGKENKEMGEKNHSKTKSLRKERQGGYWRHLRDCDKVPGQPGSWKAAVTYSLDLHIRVFNLHVIIH